MQRRENSDLFKSRLKNSETRNFSRRRSPEKRHYKKSKRRKRIPEGRKLLNSSSITNRLRATKKPMKRRWMSSSNKKLRGNTKCEKHSGSEKSKPGSTSSRMSINQEKRIFFSSRPRKRKMIGLETTRSSRLRLPLLSKTLNSKLEQLESKPSVKITRWTSCGR